MSDAVVFDFDGTLVDSYSRRGNAHEEVRDILAGFLEQNGRDVDRKALLERIVDAERASKETREWDRDEWWQTILTEYGIESPPEAVLQLATVRYWETTRTETETVPGTPAMLERLSSDGVPVGLISDTDGLDRMKNRRIAHSDLAEYFDAVVVAGEDTPRPKPDTTPFTLIASKLDISPESCLYVGDNPTTDVDGASAVGMTTVLITDPEKPAAPTEPNYTVPAAEEIPETVFSIVES